MADPVPSPSPLEAFASVREVLQLCIHSVVGWQDGPPGIFGGGLTKVSLLLDKMIRFVDTQKAPSPI
jgi:hypothetical protein